MCEPLRSVAENTPNVVHLHCLTVASFITMHLHFQHHLLNFKQNVKNITKFVKAMRFELWGFELWLDLA